MAGPGGHREASGNLTGICNGPPGQVAKLDQVAGQTQLSSQQMNMEPFNKLTFSTPSISCCKKVELTAWAVQTVVWP